MNEIVYRAQRFAIRVGRIFGGLVICGFGLWSVGEGWERVSTPFASSSLVTLVGGLFLLWLGACILVWAFNVAFGEAPPRPAAGRDPIRGS